MDNLYKETIEILEAHGKKIKDIIWIGSADGMYQLPISKMKSIFDFDYDSGYGGQIVASDLVIVGKDWWLNRGEYDGSEWWNFNTLPTLSSDKHHKSIHIVKGRLWDSVAALNDPVSR